MKITIGGYRGVLLPDPDGEIQDFLDRHQSIEDLCPFGDAPNYFSDSRQNADDGTATVVTGYGVPNSNWKPERWRLNSIYWPVTGACRYGVGIFLISADLAAKLTLQTGKVRVKCGDIQCDLWPLPIRRLVNNSYLFVGVDDRFRWQYCDLGDISLTYASKWGGILDLAGDGLFDIIADRLGITFVPGVEVSTEYSTPNFIEFQREYQNAAAALDAAAASVGQRVVVQLNSTVSLQAGPTALATVLDRIANPWTNLIAGGHDQYNRQTVPEQCRVVFQRYQSGSPQTNGDTWQITNDSDSYLGIPGIMPGAKVFNSSANAEFASDPAAVSPDNLTALTNLADEISLNYYEWVDLGTYDYTIAGVDVFDLCGGDDWLLYVLGDRIAPPAIPEQDRPLEEEDDPGERDEGYIVTTRVVSLPVNYGVENLLHAFATRRYTPIGIHRAVLSGAFGAGASGSGYLLYDNAGTITADSRLVRIYDPFARVTANHGDKFWVTGPMRDTNHFEIVSSFNPGVIRFRLKATLSNGGNAVARILTFDGAAYNEGATDIYVFDWWSVAVGLSTRGMFQGVSGMEGEAIPREVPSVAGHAEYDILWMEEYAWDAEGTLTTDPTFSGTAYASSWTAMANVDKSFHQGISPGATVTIHDDQVMYPFAKSGALCKIARSEYEASAPYYKVTVCQQLALTARATASGAWCGGTPVNVVGFTVTSPSPFNLSSIVTTAANPRNHAMEHGDDLWLALNKANGSYEIIDVELHGIGIITGLRQSPSDQRWLQAAYRTIFVERCNSTDYWSDIMLMRQFNWWCSGNYYQYCSGGSGSSGSGSGSGSTGADCDCTTAPATLVATFVSDNACWNGGSITITKSGSTWTGTGTVGGESWTITWNCITPAGPGIGGDLTLAGPNCAGGGQPTQTLSTVTDTRPNSCNPLHVEFQRYRSLIGVTGCSTCPDSFTPFYIDIVITEP